MSLLDEVRKQPDRAFRTAASQKFIKFSPILSRALGSATAAILMQQLCFLSETMADENGWFWRTADQLTEDTSLSRHEQATARTVLEKHGLIEEARAGTLGKLHFRVSFSKLHDIYEHGFREILIPRSAKQDSPKLKSRFPEVEVLLYREDIGEDRIEDIPASRSVHPGETKNTKTKAEQVAEIAQTYNARIKEGSRLTEESKSKIRTRLKTYSVEEIRTAIHHFADDAWNMANNGGRGMAWFFHSDDRIDGFINLVPRVKPHHIPSHAEVLWSKPWDNIDPDSVEGRSIAAMNAREAAGDFDQKEEE